MRKKSDSFRLVGAWKGGMPDGLVEIDYSDDRGGGTYRGHVRQGKFHGRGTRVWPNGDIYVGQWRSTTFDSAAPQETISGKKLTSCEVMTVDGAQMHGPGSYLLQVGTICGCIFMQPAKWL